jgi:hypothetical protein
MYCRLRSDAVQSGTQVPPFFNETAASAFRVNTMSTYSTDVQYCTRCIVPRYYTSIEQACVQSDMSTGGHIPTKTGCYVARIELLSIFLSCYLVFTSVYLLTVREDVTVEFDHTQSQTLCRTPLDKGWVRSMDLYLSHNAQKRQTSMSPVEFKCAVPACNWPQTHALDRAATGIGRTELPVDHRLLLCDVTIPLIRKCQPPTLVSVYRQLSSTTNRRYSNTNK